MEARIKLEKIGSAEAVVHVASSNHSHRSSSFSKPSWLLLTIADLDERIRRSAVNIPEEGNSDSFAERAEAYYQQRPQLLTLLQDLYNGYLSLADRYCQSLAKKHHRRRFSSPMSPLDLTGYDQFDGEDNKDVNDSDAESSISYQRPFHAVSQAKLDADMIIADLVIKTVDCEITMHELSIVESCWNESSRKIELQKSLLEVLESERLILLSENATLRYRFNALVEENKELASESLFMKRNAAELARCVLKMRQDHGVSILSRKIDDLQGQIYALEKRNKEYSEKLVKQDEEKAKMVKKVKNKRGEVTLENCFKVHEHDAAGNRNVAMGKRNAQQTNGVNGDGKWTSKLWYRVKNFDIILCGPQSDSSYCS